MAADHTEEDQQVMNMLHQFNININNIVQCKIPQIAEAIARSARPNQSTINDIVNRLADKMTDVTL